MILITENKFQQSSIENMYKVNSFGFLNIKLAV